MKPTISLIQIILSVLLIIVIILQQKGTGLGSSFGGDTSFYRTRRGVEKLLFNITIALSVLFIISSLVGLLVE